MPQAHRLISREFTTDSSVRTLRFIEFWAQKAEEERKEAEGNLNSVVYAVAVRLTLRSLSITYCGIFCPSLIDSAIMCIRGAISSSRRPAMAIDSPALIEGAID